MIYAGQSQLELTISGTTFPLLSLPGMQCHISTNVRQALPTLRICLGDPVSAISSTLPIVDGTQLGVILNDTSTANPTPTKFRALGTPKRMHMPGSPDVTAYVVNGLLDSIPLVRSNPNTVLTGTSNSVLQNIATANGLSFKTNVAGNDSMTWLPGKKTWAAFINHITNHSYIDSNAVMNCGIDETGTLHFYNIVPLLNAAPKAYIYFGTPSANSSSTSTPSNTFCALQYKAINRSGLMNGMGGYGQRTVQPSLDGSVSKYLATNATVTNNSLDIDSDLSSAIQPVSRMSLVAADAGNAHENYMQARHQNHRLKCSYSQNIYVLLYQTSGLNIFDTVKFTATSGSSSPNSLVDGTYLVTGIARTLWSNRYYEKIELTTNGPITSSNAGLLS